MGNCCQPVPTDPVPTDPVPTDPVPTEEVKPKNLSVTFTDVQIDPVCVIHKRIFPKVQSPSHLDLSVTPLEPIKELPILESSILKQIQSLCIIKVALKLPNGTDAVQYNEDKKVFEECNIDDWLQSLYKDKQWTSWIIYNDDTSELGNKTTALGHCKGILAWNNTHLSWLVHSVPNFPREFTGSTISPIEHGEHIYGQSFLHLTRQADDAFVKQVVQQIHLMEAHIYMKNVEVPEVTPKQKEMNTIEFSTDIFHIAKSPHNKIDIYEYLDMYATDWYVETWRRGHPINTPSHVKDVYKLCVNGVEYKESQDHSKWATSGQYYLIGDLNRMTSQFKRGGGGFLVKHQGVATALKSFIKAFITNT
jgi:deoxyribonuclease-2